MQTNYNKSPKAGILWNSVFVGILVAIAAGIYLSLQSMDYTWRWERIPQYILYEYQEEIKAPFDATAYVDEEGVIRLVADDDPTKTLVIESYSSTTLTNDYPVYEGDSVAVDTGWRSGPLLDGLYITLKISVISILFAVIIGVLAGLGRISTNPVLRNLSITYIELIRGTPLLVQIFIFYFFIGTLLNLDRFTAGVAALSVFTGAYIAEIVRAGIQSIPKGQMEAARSLGMTHLQAMTYVIMPQAIKRTLPPMAGQFINLIKDSSLVSVISITDLTKAGREVVASTFSAFEVWIVVAMLYLVLTGTLSWLVQKLEKRLAASD